MSDQPRQSHEEWEELAAARALDALDAEDEQRLAAHVATCDVCQQALDDYNLVAAQLGSLADDQEAPPSWQRIRSAVIGVEPAGSARSPESTGSVESAGREPASRAAVDGGSPDGVAPVVPMARPASSPPLWRRPRVLAAAAAIVLVVAGGLAGWQLTSRSSQPSATAAVTACLQQSGCQVVRLHSGAASNTAAVIVDSGHASVVPLKLAKPPAGQMYVLWQLPRDGSGMIPVEGFRQTRHQTAGSQLPHAYGDTTAFAVSLEPAGSLPTRPSGILAIGTT